MLKVEKTEVVGWEAAIRGMRNPLNSHDKGDSTVGFWNPDFLNENAQSHIEISLNDYTEVYYYIGAHDQDLMKRLRDAGFDHRKFMRMITVYADITAPLYWWKEADTYQVGVVKNSCSTMHTIHTKEFTLDDFSHEHLIKWNDDLTCDLLIHEGHESLMAGGYPTGMSPNGLLNETILMLNAAREKYLETKDKKYWWQMIQLLPSSYNQKRTVMLNYEVLANMYESRKNHKLDEWHTLCDWMKTLPYSELITGEFEE